MEKILKIISNIINGIDEKIEIDERTYNIASFHSLTPFLYPNAADSTNEAILKKIKSDYFQAIKRDSVQLGELNKILAVFEKENIDSLPLKGSVIKQLYPDTFYRVMGDIDILVKESDFKNARKIIESMNYKAKSNAEHHLEFEKPPFMIIELHRDLIVKKDYGSAIFKDILKRTNLKENSKNTHIMSDEDFYLFMMCHLLKHLYSGGTGIRSFLDVYVYINKKPNLDWNYINSMLGKTKFANECENIKSISLKMFTDVELTEQEQEQISNIITYGTYGTMDVLSKNELDENNNSANKVVLKKMFPSVSTMKGLYPVLKKCIILLPIMYVVRIFHLLFHFKHSYSRAKELKRVEKENKKKEK